MINNEVDEMVDNSFFDTPELEVPAATPDAHRAVITSVEGIVSSQKGTPGIKLSFTSLDVPTLDMNKVIWLPKGYVASLGNGSFDPKSLDEKGQTSYRMSVANKEKTAELQVLQAIALEAGRVPAELGIVKATSFETYAENYSKLLTGLEVIVTRRERGGDDPAFKHSLEPRRIAPINDAEVNPKRYSKINRAWEQEG